MSPKKNLHNPIIEKKPVKTNFPQASCLFFNGNKISKNIFLPLPQKGRIPL